MSTPLQRPNLTRPKFGEVRVFRGEQIRIVSYKDNNNWYYVKYIPEDMAGPNNPMRAYVAWNSLPIPQ